MIFTIPKTLDASIKKAYGLPKNKIGVQRERKEPFKKSINNLKKGNP